MDENKKLEFRGSSFMALVPFAIFPEHMELSLRCHYMQHIK